MDNLLQCNIKLKRIVLSNVNDIGLRESFFPINHYAEKHFPNIFNSDKGEHLEKQIYFDNMKEKKIYMRKLYKKYILQSQTYNTPEKRFQKSQEFDQEWPEEWEEIITHQDFSFLLDADMNECLNNRYKFIKKILSKIKNREVYLLKNNEKYFMDNFDYYL